MGIMVKKLLLILFAAMLLPVLANATVTGIATSASFVCSNSQGPFPFTFPISAPTAMTVVQNGTVLSSSAYTIVPVNNNYDNGGSVTLNTACPTAQTLVLQRVTPITQLTQYTPYMPDLPANVESSLDKVTEIEQEIKGSGGGMIYPDGTGIPEVNSGTSWGSTYNATNQIPANFLNLSAYAPLAGATFTGAISTPGFTLNGGTEWTSSSSANSQVVTCPTGGTGTQVCDAAGAWIANGGGVSSINSNTGAFTFTGAGVSCTTTTCTFTGGTGSGTVQSGTAYSPAYYPTGGGAVVAGVTPFTGLAWYATSAAPAQATSANIQTAIGASVYDAYGAAAARQANLSLLAGTYINGDMCTYVSSGTLLNCNTAIPTVGTWGALNYPSWVSGTPFVKMTAAGTFSLDTNTYLTSSGISGMTSGQLAQAGGATTITSSIAYTTANTASTIAERDASGNINAQGFTDSALTSTYCVAGGVSGILASATGPCEITLPSITSDISTIFNAAAAVPNTIIDFAPNTQYTASAQLITNANFLKVNFNGNCIVSTYTGGPALHITGSVTSGANDRFTDVCFIPGAASTYAAVQDDGWGTIIHGLYFSQATGHTPAGGYYWDYKVQAGADESFTITGMKPQANFGAYGHSASGSSQSVTPCTSSFCGWDIYHPNNDGGILFLSDSDLEEGCSGNGIYWNAVNALSIKDTIIQGWNQVAILVPSASGGGSVTLSGVNYQTTGGSCTNPMANNIKADIPLVVGPGVNVTSSNSSMGNGDYNGVVATGSTGEKYAYYVHFHDGGAASIPIYLGTTSAAATLGGGNSVSITILTSPTAGETCDFERIDQTLYPGMTAYPTNGINTAIPALQGVACGSGAGTYITETDSTPTSSLAAYSWTTYPAADDELFGQNGWMGGSVLLNGGDGDHAKYTGPCVIGGGVVEPSYAVNTGQTWFTCVGSVEEAYGSNSNAISQALIGRTSGFNYNTSVPSAIVTPDWYKYSPLGGGLKGIYNTSASMSWWPWAGGPTDVFTLIDSNPFKTMGTAGNRPTWDVNDTAIGIDGINNGLAFRDPVSITFYLGAIFDNVNYYALFSKVADQIYVPTTIYDTLALTQITGSTTNGSKGFLTSSGHLSAGTYYYVVQGVTALGHVVTSTEISIVPTSGSTNAPWFYNTFPTGVTGYNYGRATSSGAETQCNTAPIPYSGGSIETVDYIATCSGPSFTNTNTMPAVSFQLGTGTPMTGQTSANSQIVTCPTGGTGTQVCDAAGAWIANGGGSGTTFSGTITANTTQSVTLIASASQPIYQICAGARINGGTFSTVSASITWTQNSTAVTSWPTTSNSTSITDVPSSCVPVYPDSATAVTLNLTQSGGLGTGEYFGTIGGGTGFNGAAGTSYQDALEIVAPANPASTYDRLYLDSTAHQLKCLTSSGGSCMPSGGGGTTTNALTAAATGGAAPGSSFNGSTSVTFDAHSFGAPGLATANAYTVGAKQTFASSSTTAGFNFAGVASDPSSLAIGDMWRNTTVAHLKFYDSTSTTQTLAELADIPSALPPNGSASGDLSGSYPNPTVAQIEGAAIPVSAAVAGTNSSKQIVAATPHQVVAPIQCADTSSSSTTYTCTTTPSIGSLTTGDMFIFTSINQNNSGSATLNIDTIGAKTIKKWQNTANLAAGDLQAGAAVKVIYDGTYFEIATIGNAPSGSGGITSINGNSTAAQTINNSDGTVNVSSSSGTTTVSLPAVTYWSSPFLGATNTVPNSGASSHIQGWGFVPSQTVTFSNIYAVSKTADASYLYSLAIANSSGTLICHPTTGTNVPAANTLWTNACSEGSVTIYAGQVYVLLGVGTGTTGGVMGFNASTMNGLYYSANISGFSTASGVVSGTGSITLAPAIYIDGIPNFMLH
jgi:hypothetical protein